MSERVADRALSAARREERDLGLRFMLYLLAGIACTLVLLAALAYLIFPGQFVDKRFAEPFPTFPLPRLQTDTAVDWQAFYRHEMAWLNSAGWQDKAAGTLHIPIDQAMRKVASEGISGWPTGNPHVSDGDRR